MDYTPLNRLTYGMYVVATKVNDKKVGCFVNTVMQVNAENPTIAVCINKNNYSNEALKTNGKFTVSILSKDIDPKVIGRFGFFSSRDTEKFDGFDYEEIEEIPYLTSKVCGVLLCEVLQVVDAETHNLFIARVLDTKNLDSELEPMTYKYYHEVIKGKVPKTAPTYSNDK